MNWNAQDNKHYTGKLDQMYVSRTEPYEVNYAIDDWLGSRNLPITDANRNALRSWISRYPGSAPVLRTALYTWLDANVPINR